MPKILIIDHDSFFVSILKRKFEDAGFSVATAANGNDGLRQAQSKRPRAILLDLALPGVDGFQVLSQLQSDPVTRFIPVTVLTDLGRRDDIDRCLSLGAVSYVLKVQTSPDEIVEAVKRTVV